jgi:hypothetical protein
MDKALQAPTCFVALAREEINPSQRRRHT